jgi:hypothetical protein
MNTKPVGLLLSLAVVSGLVACGDDVSGPQTRQLAMTSHQLVPVWTISRDQDLACGGGKAGGQVGGIATFTELGVTAVEVSAAWDVANLLQTPQQYNPTGPAGGPRAPVLDQDDYPYTFRFNPSTNACGQTNTATGKVILTAADGGRVLGDIVGGEAHRLDFVLQGDGVESFVEVEVTGGTGRYEDVTGSFVVHVIVQFRLATMDFGINLAEILPGGTLRF